MRRVLIVFTTAFLLYLSSSYWYLPGSPYSQYSQNFSSYIIHPITKVNYYFSNLTQLWNELEFWFLTKKNLHQRLNNLEKIESELQKTKLELINSQKIINQLSLLTNFNVPKDFSKITVKVYGSPVGFYDSQIFASSTDNIPIKKDTIAISDQGIVGRIIEASSSLIRIMLITDMASRVPVKITETGENCIAVGNGTNTMTLEHLQSHEMITNSYKRPPEIGDVLVTSGVGGIFPSDLPVGTITSIKDDEITIKPFVIFHKLEVVSILYDQTKL